MERFQANPLIVAAVQIKELAAMPCSLSTMAICADGSTHELTWDMTKAYRPVNGDYLMLDEDGKHIKNKAEFERKYSRI